MTKPILFFREEHFFLSNFYMSPVIYEGLTYPSSEHAYQAAKSTDKDVRKSIRDLGTAGAAKKAGAKIELRPGWENLKIQVMRDILTEKFKNPDLRALLLATGDAHLEEGNEWGDTFWGVCKFGHNHLGKLLMEIRQTLRLHVDFEDDWKALGHEPPCPECKNTGYTSDNLCSCPLGDRVTLNFQGQQYQGAALRALLAQSPAILSPLFPPASLEELIRSFASGSLVLSSGGGGSVVTEVEFRVMAAIIRAYAPEGVYNAVLHFDSELTPVEVDNLTERIHAAAPPMRRPYAPPVMWIDRDLHPTDTPTDTPSSGDLE